MRATLATLVTVLSVCATARAADITFGFEDARLLRDNESGGGLVHVPPTIEGASASVPLVVFLHGVNEAGPLHYGLGAGAFDVRTIVDALVDADEIDAPLVAGPSQTRDAWSGAKLWNDFDLSAFIDATERASSLKIDRARIVLAGFSGAGCNATGGLLSPMNVRPLAIVALDTCMDERFGKLWAKAADTTAVHIAYQNLIWPREYGAFTSAVEANLAKGRTLTIKKHNSPAANPHEEVVRLGLRAVLPTLLPPPEDDDD